MLPNIYIRMTLHTLWGLHWEKRPGVWACVIPTQELYDESPDPSLKLILPMQDQPPATGIPVRSGRKLVRFFEGNFGRDVYRSTAAWTLNGPP